MTMRSYRPRPVKLTKTVATVVSDTDYQTLCDLCSQRNITLSEFIREALQPFLG